MIVRALLGGNEMDFAEPPLRFSGVFYWSHWGTGDLLKTALQKPRAGKDAGKICQEQDCGPFPLGIHSPLKRNMGNDRDIAVK